MSSLSLVPTKAATRLYNNQRQGRSITNDQHKSNIKIMSMMITEADIGPLKPKFPQKLYSLLGMEDVQHTITWLPDGR